MQAACFLNKSVDPLLNQSHAGIQVGLNGVDTVLLEEDEHGVDHPTCHFSKNV